MSKTSVDTFSIGESYRQAWEIFKSKWVLALGSLLLFYVISFVASYILGSMQESGSDGSAAVFSIVLNIVLTISGMGWMLIYIKLARKEETGLADLFSPWRNFLKYFGFSILFAIIVILGLIAFIIPGLYFMIKYTFGIYLVIDKGLGPIAALKASSKMTKGIILKLVAMFFVSLGVNILGLLALGVGILVTAPVSMIAMMVVYNRMLGRLDNAELATTM